ncbi:MAG TPA: acetoacetate--CoA ligase [Streptosporangiaceae bacterium]|nr:acetoacetate--CoA ligase [Streptosporangiaceae bacterium]
MPDAGDLLSPGVSVREGDLLWTPSPDQRARANITHFTSWLATKRQLDFGSYDALWQWSVTDLDGFWQAVWDYCGIEASTPPAAVLGQRTMPGADWFPGARLNYAEHILRRDHGGDALLFAGETVPLQSLTWATLTTQVRTLATHLRALGVQPGDRVAAYLPNVPHTVIAMLATASIGAIWTSCSPDFGWRGVLDRFRQLSPVVLICTDGYRYGGRPYDRHEETQHIAAGLPSLRHVIYLPLLDPGHQRPPDQDATSWDEITRSPAPPAASFRFEQVPFSHPLWILFSSGTTGLPKAITHSQGGILAEQLKLQTFHMNLGPGDRMLFYTTTGWMMWNFLASSLLLGVQPVLYDGNPGYPGPDVLWRLAEDAGVTFFGASPAYVDALTRAKIVPGRQFGLGRLNAVMLAGSPVSAECSAWFYRNVKRDLWLATGSGGTDTCCGLVGGTPTLPVYAGEIQARHLGVAAYAYGPDGQPVTDGVGELVLTQPMPSMPVRFWGDDDGSRYRAAYFEEFPGRWRQGDFFRVNGRGGCFVLGRSDATLNRDGVRIGTAEIYAALATVPGVADGLVVSLDRPGGGFFMPLFVKLAPGQELDARLRAEIRQRLRTQYTPRHVPDAIIEVPDIPVTLTGKKMEVPVRRILAGTAPGQAANPNAMANPASLDVFAEYARTLPELR